MDKLLIWGMTDTREDAICLDDEFGLMLTKVRIPVPAPKLNYVEIPLSSTVIDFSEFADAIHFEQSVTRLTFVRAAAGTRESWLELWLNIQAAIHGEEFHWCFASDESNIYTGRFILSDWLSSGALGTFVLEIHQTRAAVERVTVTLADGQGNSESEYVASGDTYTIPASPFTRTGYTWFRWNTAADGSGTDYDPGDEITLTADTTLYAIWGHVITFNANGGSGTMAALQVDEGDSVTLTTNAYTYGTYTYQRWNTAADHTGTDYADGASITPASDITLYAVWASVVSFNANGGSGSISPVTVLKGATLTLDPTGFSRGSLTFRRWNTASDYSGTYYTPTATITPTGAMTLYAVWGCTVTYYPNDGSGTMPAETYDYGTTHSLTAATFTRTDYTFDGWNTAADGTGTDYADGASVTLTDNLALYAQWQAGSTPIVPQEGDVDTDVTDNTTSGRIVASDGTYTAAKWSDLLGYWLDPIDGYIWQFQRMSGEYRVNKNVISSFDSQGYQSTTAKGKYLLDVTNAGTTDAAPTDGIITLSRRATSENADIGSHWFRIYGDDNNVLRLQLTEGGDTIYRTLFKSGSNALDFTGAMTDPLTGTCYVIMSGYYTSSSSGPRYYMRIDLAQDGSPVVTRFTGTYYVSTVDGVQYLNFDNNTSYEGVWQRDSQTRESYLASAADLSVVRLRDYRPRGLNSALTAGSYKSENGDTLTLTGDWTNGMTAVLNGVTLPAGKILTSQGPCRSMPVLNDVWNPSGDWTSRGKLAIGTYRYNVNMLSEQLFLFEDVSTGTAVVWSKIS